MPLSSYLNKLKFEKPNPFEDIHTTTEKTNRLGRKAAKEAAMTYGSVKGPVYNPFEDIEIHKSSTMGGGSVPRPQRPL